MGNCLTRKSQIDLSGIYNQDNAQRGWTNAGVYATTAYLRITSDKEFYYLEISDDGKKFQSLGRMDFRYLTTEVIGGFTGVMLGVFAQGGKGYAEYDWMEYEGEWKNFVRITKKHNETSYNNNLAYGPDNLQCIFAGYQRHNHR